MRKPGFTPADHGEVGGPLADAYAELLAGQDRVTEAYPLCDTETAR